MTTPSTPKPRPCPHCGQPLIASTPAAPAPAEPPKPETWRDREKPL